MSNHFYPEFLETKTAMPFPRMTMVQEMSNSLEVNIT